MREDPNYLLLQSVFDVREWESDSCGMLGQHGGMDYALLSPITRICH
jgi:hypothetical protein